MTDRTIVHGDVEIRRGKTLLQSSCQPSSSVSSVYSVVSNALSRFIALLAGLALLLTPRVAFPCNPPPPSMARSPWSLAPSAYQGQSPAVQTFQVWNSSVGTLNYTISKNQTWLSVSPSTGSSTGEHDIITVSYSTASLAVGSYNATIMITSPYALYSPQAVYVTLTINAAPLVILHGGQSASGQTFCVPFSTGHTGQYYRDLAGLTAASIVDQDEKREWADTDWGPWTRISDTSHPAPAWSYSPSGTITAACTLTVTCAWTDDNSPTGTQDAQQSDSATIIVGVPIAPDELSATPISSRRIDLAWADNATDETGYRVFRSTDGLHFTQIAQIPASSAYFKDRDLSAATKYYYRVRAYNAQGSSDYSNSADATTLDAPFFLETWNSTFWPVHPNDSFTTNSTGAVYAADEPWTWTTENGDVRDCAFRSGDDAHEIGRFSAGAQAGDFTLSAPAGSVNLTESEDVSLFTLFQVTIDQTGSDSGRRFALQYRNETSFNVSAPTYISMWLDGETDQPALHIQASDEGQASNAIEAPLGIGGYGGAGTYRVEATFSPSEQGLDVAYSVTDESAPETPVLSGSDTLDQIPSANLHQLQLAFQQRSVGALDDISLTAEGETGAPEPPPPGGQEEPAPPSFTFAPADIGTTGTQCLEGLGLEGFNPGDLAGYSLSAVGDVNGDGYEDVIVGAPGRKGSDYPWSPWAGEAYLVYGSTSGPSADSVLLKPAHVGLALPSPPIFAAGSSVAGVGDFNGDGFNDFAIGAPWGLCDNQTGDNGNAAGEVYLIYGGHSIGGASRTVTLSSPDRTVGLLLEGVEMGDNTGLSVAGAGDVDGDGYADLLIGAPDASPDGKTGAGKAYLVFGGPDLGGAAGMLDLGALTSSNRVIIFNGAAAADHAGRSVAGAGDVNGDGLADILIGAPDADPLSRTDAGAVYLVYGSESFAFDAPFELSTLASASGVVIQGAAAGDHTGWSVAGVGDARYAVVVGDALGLADFLIGAPEADPSGHEDAGTAYLIFGKTAIDTYGTGTFDLSTEVATGRGKAFLGAAAGDRAGAAVSAAGDADGDGWADLLIGAPGADPEFLPNPPVDNGGEAYVIYSGQLALGGPFQLPVDGTGGTTLKGNDTDEALGHSVSDSGDLNGDGIPDRLAGANGGADSPGEVFFVPGDETAAASATYRAYCKPGDAPKTAVGSVSAADPPSRCWINYSAGAYTSQEIVTLTRSSGSISNFPQPTNTLANVLWRVQPNRTGAGEALVAFEYLNSEIQGIPGVSEWSLQLWEAGSPTGTWSLVSDQSVNPSKNQILAQVSTASDRYFALAATGTSTTPSTIHVYPDGLWTVQDAIGAVNPGGTVVVHPGTYRENIIFAGKNLTLRSEDPEDPAVRAITILDGMARGPVVMYAGSETATCVLEGLTIRNGSATAGGGITGNNTLATIRCNVIAENEATQYGAGLHGCSGVIERNEIRDNYSHGSGGGLADCSGAGCKIQNNIIYRNWATALNACGGGLYQCNALILNNTIWANTAYKYDNATDSGTGQGGGLAFCEGSAVIKNNIIWDNAAAADSQVSSCNAPSYCCIQDCTPANGNINGDPCFLFPENGDMRLEPGQSSCIGWGTWTGVDLAEDFEGEQRSTTDPIDIGADENHLSSLPPAPTNLTCTFVEASMTATLNWSGSSSEYKVYRSNLPRGPYVLLQTVSGTTQYADSAIASGQSYSYIVTAGGAASASAAPARIGTTHGYAIAGHRDGDGVRNNCADARARHYNISNKASTGEEFLNVQKSWCDGPDEIDKLVVFSHGIWYKITLNMHDDFYISWIVPEERWAHSRDLGNLLDMVAGDIPNGIMPDTIDFASNSVIILQACQLGRNRPPGSWDEDSFAQTLSTYVHVSPSNASCTVYAPCGLCYPSDENGRALREDEPETGWFGSEHFAWRKFVNGSEVHEPWNSDPLMRPPLSDGTSVMRCW